MPASAFASSFFKDLAPLEPMLTQQHLSTHSLPAHLINQHISSDGQIWYEVQLAGSSTRSWIRKDYIHLALAFNLDPQLEDVGGLEDVAPLGDAQQSDKVV